MRVLASAALAAVLIVTLTGCESDVDRAHQACLDGARTVVESELQENDWTSEQASDRIVEARQVCDDLTDEEIVERFGRFD